ncbi:MAG: hypothetical protein WB992_15830 [Bryobacteraceae bacterium]
MKLTAITTMMLMTGAGAHGQSSTAVDRSVAVCTDGEAAGFGAIHPAQMLASKIFGGIGVRIEWRRNLRDCPADRILISLRSNTPAALYPGALASARPYEGIHIQVFYDRISKNPQPALVSIVLAHVLVHEITHILQGSNGHSEQGIMKAHWNAGDYFQMRCKPLGFTDHDVLLIYRGLAARKARTVLAMNAEMGVVVGAP